MLRRLFQRYNRNLI